MPSNRLDELLHLLQFPFHPLRDALAHLVQFELAFEWLYQFLEGDLQSGYVEWARLRLHCL